jgi:hypothetical protein
MTSTPSEIRGVNNIPFGGGLAVLGHAEAAFDPEQVAGSQDLQTVHLRPAGQMERIDRVRDRLEAEEAGIGARREKLDRPHAAIGGPKTQCIHHPPSTVRFWPVMKRARSETRNRIASAMSSGRPRNLSA